MMLDRFPRLRLAHLPTPLEPLPRLSKALGGPAVWMKRDDCTGLATGGNKTRKLEFLMADARGQGADTVITPGAIQSNHARQTAAAAARLGLRCEILVERRAGADAEYRHSGNMLLDRLCGAHIREYPQGAPLDTELEAVVAELRTAGRRPYAIPVGGSNPVGALGYAGCALELLEQAGATKFTELVHATGSAGTQAGLLAGLHARGNTLPVLGICVSRAAGEQETKVRRLTEETLALLQHPEALPRERVQTNSDYIGAGYGIPTEGMRAAVELTARTEGILLDPVYAGKAMAGLIALIRAGRYAAGEHVVFLHTGGSAALFAYRATFAG